jgi:hypothetical protein
MVGALLEQSSSVRLALTRPATNLPASSRPARLVHKAVQHSKLAPNLHSNAADVQQDMAGRQNPRLVRNARRELTTQSRDAC